MDVDGDTEVKDRVELGNTSAWLDILYGKCQSDDGVLVFVRPERNRVQCVHTVGSGRDLVDAARDVNGKKGVYLKINLMDYERMSQRSKKERKSVVGSLAEVRTVVSIHLDVDAGKGGKYLSRSHALWAIDQMPLKPTLVVNSNGQEGGFHVYWVLSEPVRIESEKHRSHVQSLSSAWNERLKYLCAGKLDSTSNLDRVLRVVGGSRKDGGRVNMHDYEPENLYRIEDFER